MRVVFMGKSKRSAVLALDWLVERGVEVPAVVAPEPDETLHEQQRLDLAARRHGLALVSEEELYADPPAEVDAVVSYLFWNLIREPLLSLGSIGCLNFHPAPLPDYRGVGGYNVAILEGLPAWGVSCHFVDERFDTGDLVEVERFADRRATPKPPSRSTSRARSTCSRSSSACCNGPSTASRCRARHRATAATCRGRSSTSCGWCSRATTSAASCARSGTHPGPAR